MNKCIYNGKWELSMDELLSLITPKTKMILINTPRNFTGKVFTLEELHAIGDLLLIFLNDTSTPSYAAPLSFLPWQYLQFSLEYN